MSTDPRLRLTRMVSDRQAILDQIIADTRTAGMGALLLIGSLGRGGGDAWSDLDLIAVPGPGSARLDLVGTFAGRVLARLQAPRNAPAGGAYQGLCLQISDGVLWVDLYLWPAATAAIPADGTVVFDHLGLPASTLEFIPLITAHADPTAATHPDSGATTLLRLAVAAKYLARGDHARLTAALPQTAGMSLGDTPGLLRRTAASVSEPDLADAVAATIKLIDLAAAVGGDQTNQRNMGGGTA